MVVAIYFEMEQHATSRTLLPVIVLVQQASKKLCYCRIPGIVGTTQCGHLDIARYQLSALDNSSTHPESHSRISEVCMTGMTNIQLIMKLSV